MVAIDFDLPEEISARGYDLRVECEYDLSFLSELYASTREGELAHISRWSVADRRTFCDQQFMAQQKHYQGYIPDCIYLIVEYRGEPVGRLYLDERTTQIHVVDIALLPEHRGLGFGTAIFRSLAEVGASRRKSIGIFVEKNNPALRLYRRLGFTPVSETDFYLEMERLADLAALPVN